MEEKQHDEVQHGQIWYCVDRVEPHGWELREVLIRKVVGEEVMLVQQGFCLEVSQGLLRACYASTPDAAWRQAEQRMVEKTDELRAAREAWLEKGENTGRK